MPALIFMQAQGSLQIQLESFGSQQFIFERSQLGKSAMFCGQKSSIIFFLYYWK